jgi:hypothetical protein
MKRLKIVFVLPHIIFFLVFPFGFFLPVLLKFFRWGVGIAAGIRVDFHGCGAAITFVYKDTINVMAFDTGHSFLLMD